MGQVLDQILPPVVQFHEIFCNTKKNEYINLVSISKDITSLFWIENYSDFKYFSFPFFRSENPDQYSKIFNNKQSLW